MIINPRSSFQQMYLFSQKFSHNAISNRFRYPYSMTTLFDVKKTMKTIGFMDGQKP